MVNAGPARLTIDNDHACIGQLLWEIKQYTGRVPRQTLSQDDGS